VDRRRYTTVRWRIYYGDGTTASDGAGDLYTVRSTNVQAIVQADDDVGRYVLHSADFYWWDRDAGQWFQSDQFGLWDYLSRPGPAKVLFGRSLANVQFKDLLDIALTDPDFPPKSGRRPGEPG
jgi:hypothetical protein